MKLSFPVPRRVDRRVRGRFRPLGLALALVLPGLSAAPPLPLDLRQALHLALQHYPTIVAAEQRLAAARAGVALERSRYLPRTDLLWQENRASDNNVTGLLLPQGTLPSISGPVLPDTAAAGSWGSAAGALFSWEPFDFGVRRADVAAARAGSRRADALLELTRLDVAAAAGQAFLIALAAQERVRAAEADVQRRTVFSNTVHVLVTNELRPGAEGSRAAAELAVARTHLAEAQEQAEEADLQLADSLGMAGVSLRAIATGVAGLPPVAPSAERDLAAHPLARAAQASLLQAEARETAAAHAYAPHFAVQGAAFGRGSGVRPDGTRSGGVHGLGLQRENWAMGLTVSFPLMDFAAARARRDSARAARKEQQADNALTEQALTTAQARAATRLRGARAVADNLPAQLEAARLSEQQARARYQAGLGTALDVADAQRLLVEAETEAVLAHLAVWRAQLGVALAQGDLRPFLQLLPPEGQP